MEVNLQILTEKIEKLRILLYNLINSNKQLTDKSVVDCSQQLDKLLSEYENYKKNVNPKDAA
ncbi:aspartyl-phosphate phosphatase Spo0E family protein [Clostridium sp. SYSU_GA19001]|uniref:aspartyl-phosphate phosphatase Spo0E family protein n=1 Tax=Clostridium caldaquaticum TaxID=2940653 RepID=UPI0020772E9B|nr:aspartyl-phosphate phosphatase Spo0E family protein [Clostridium caldaquaticum]MCM8710343.1 aspartyl-phosphate phosphatase Spo0E family protein [Clostridium caldaquaticum]